MIDSMRSKRAIGLVPIAFGFVAIVYFIVFFSTVNEEGSVYLPTSWWIAQACILVLGVCGIAFDKRSYSVNKMHWYFIVAFMGLAPIVQLATGYYPWNYLYTIDSAMGASGMVLLWCFVYMISHRVINVFACRKHSKSSGCVLVSDFPEWYLLAISISIVVVKLVLNGSGAFLQAGVLPEAMKSASVLPAVVDRALTAMPAFCLAILRLRYSSVSKVPILSLLLLLASTLFVLNPLTSSRYILGSVLIALFVLLAPSATKGRRFDFLVIVALFVIFPIMTDWARVNDGGLSLENISKMLDGFSLTSGFTWVDFDAYSLAARTIDYVERFGTTGGHQLVSALLFFIPDSVWVDKGQMTSDLLVSALTPGGQTNLSTPLMAEGYIDFGIVGVVFFAAVAGSFSSIFDRSYWQTEKLTAIKVAYPFFLGFTIFIMRGTLLYGYMWTVSFFAGLALLWCPVYVFKRGKYNE